MIKQKKYSSIWKTPMLCLVCFFILITLSPLGFVRAQNFQPVEQIVLTVSPRIPEPGDTVRISAQSYTADINRAYLVWSVNGTVIEEGEGKNQIEFVLGEAGSQSRVRVTMSIPGGMSAAKEITLYPASVDLIWEASTYTPPFYRGKALAASKSSITIVALPHIVEESGGVPAENLIYTWKIGSTILGDKSGRNRRSLTVEGAQLYRSLDVSVTVESPNSLISAERRVSIPAFLPGVLIYEDHPTRGVLFEQVIDETFLLRQEEVTFLAIPLFFSSEEGRFDPAFTYRWSINGEGVAPAGVDKSQITLRPTGGSGQSRVGLSVRTTRSLLQGAGGEFSILFGEDGITSTAY